MFDLECRDLTKRFGDFTAVDNVSMSVEKGSFYSILGPSGCGKTTLMRMLAGFERQESGEIRIQGRSMTGIPPNKRPVNMVFQHLALFVSWSWAGKCDVTATSNEPRLAAEFRLRLLNKPRPVPENDAQPAQDLTGFRADCTCSINGRTDRMASAGIHCLENIPAG